MTKQTGSCIFFIFLSYLVHVAYTTTMIARKSMKSNHKIFWIVAKTDRYLQPFVLVMIWQPVDGVKRCRYD